MKWSEELRNQVKGYFLYKTILCQKVALDVCVINEFFYLKKK